jgi:hypothetical protein
MNVVDPSVEAVFSGVSFTGLRIYPVCEGGPSSSGGGVHCICDVETEDLCLIAIWSAH